MSDYTLYSYWRSSCSARLRIALNLKGISFETVPVNLVKNEHLSDTHRALNPSATVPLLVHHLAPGGSPFKVGQSVAALEYLEEIHPEHPLFPPSSKPEDRATIRVLVNIVCCDTQPVTNLRMRRRVESLGGNAEQWNRELMTDGLRAYEAVAAPCAGKYSYGDVVTLADVCLLPTAWNATRVGVDLAQFPTVARVVKHLEELPAVKKASYFCQPDTPEDMRSQ